MAKLCKFGFGFGLPLLLSFPEMSSPLHCIISINKVCNKKTKNKKRKKKNEKQKTKTKNKKQKPNLHHHCQRFPQHTTDK